MGTEKEKKPASPPKDPKLLDHLEEEEDARVAAEEAGEIADEDSAAVDDAREGRIP